MKTTNRWWKTILALLLLGGAAGPGWAVNPDTGGPCWRGAPNSTEQVWTFDISANPIAPSVLFNQPGSPTAAMTLGNFGAGWYDTGCGGACGTVVTALLPIRTVGFDTVGDPNQDDWDQGPPYVAAQDPTFQWTLPYTNPPTLGDAQGFWDMGGAGNKLVLTIPNNGAPTNTFRYFFIQGTYNVSSVSGLPFKYAVTNSAGAGNSTQIWTKTDTLVEQPLAADGSLSPNAWHNQRVVLRVAAGLTAGSDTLTITNATPFWVDAMIVETLDRVAGNDALNTALNTATNIPYAQLLANDRGGNLVSVGGAVNGTVGTNAGNVVTFTPTPSFTGTASFWYTNQDCMGTNLSAQVTVNVLPGPPVANPDYYTRPKGAALKIKISDLLTNDTDPNGFTLTVTGVSPQSTNGTHLALNGNLLVYTNSVTTNANDQFGYTITNGQGRSATGLVNITVVGGQAGQTTATITVGASNQVSLVFYGVPGTVYQVQRSTNSGSSWTTIGSALANNYNTPPAGQVGYTDNFADLLPSPGIPPTALYRLFLP